MVLDIRPAPVQNLVCGHFPILITVGSAIIGHNDGDSDFGTQSEQGRQLSSITLARLHTRANHLYPRALISVIQGLRSVFILQLRAVPRRKALLAQNEIHGLEGRVCRAIMHIEGIWFEPHANVQVRSEPSTKYMVGY